MLYMRNIVFFIYENHQNIVIVKTLFGWHQLFPVKALLTFSFSYFFSLFFLQKYFTWFWHWLGSSSVYICICNCNHWTLIEDDGCVDNSYSDQCGNRGIVYWGDQRQAEEGEERGGVLPSVHQRRRRRREGAMVRRESHPRGKPSPSLPRLHRRSRCHPSILDGSCPWSLWGHPSLPS